MVFALAPNSRHVVVAKPSEQLTLESLFCWHLWHWCIFCRFISPFVALQMFEAHLSMKRASSHFICIAVSDYYSVPCCVARTQLHIISGCSRVLAQSECIEAYETAENGRRYHPTRIVVKCILRVIWTTTSFAAPTTSHKTHGKTVTNKNQQRQNIPLRLCK